MPLVKCDKCDGKGTVLIGEPMSLANLLEPFIEKDRIGFRFKTGAAIPRLASLESQELMGEVVERINGIE